MAYFRSYQILESHDRTSEIGRVDDDEYYLEKMQRILSGPPYLGVPFDPTPVLPNVYLGSQANAENLDCIKRMKFKYVLNVAGLPTTLRQARARRYPPEVTYMELPVDEQEGFNISPYFNDAHNFIARGATRGRVLVHCTGASRSGAIMVGYMLSQGIPLLRATRELKNDRRNVCTNVGFMKALIQLAKTRGLLDGEPEKVRAPRYGRRIDRPRINSAHLPLIL